jgi:prevent-host-death family protein
MIRVALNEVKDDLSRYLRLAETEDVIITRHGVPAGLLIGFGDPDDWWEEMLLRNPRFQERVEQARQSLREGKGITLEELREKYDIPYGSAKTQKPGVDTASQAAGNTTPRRSRGSRKPGNSV